MADHDQPAAKARQAPARAARWWRGRDGWSARRAAGSRARRPGRRPARRGAPRRPRALLPARVRIEIEAGHGGFREVAPRLDVLARGQAGEHHARAPCDGRESPAPAPDRRPWCGAAGNARRASSSIRPASAFRSVDLPAPLRPIRQIRSPRPTARLRPVNTGSGPIRTVALRSESRGAMRRTLTQTGTAAAWLPARF